MNIRRLTANDSRGQESKILGIAIISWLAMLAKFIVGGWTLPFLGEQPVWTMGEFSAGTAGLLAVIAARKWIRDSAEAKVEAATVMAFGNVKAAEKLADAKVTGDAVLAKAVEERKT